MLRRLLEVEEHAAPENAEERGASESLEYDADGEYPVYLADILDDVERAAKDCSWVDQGCCLELWGCG